MCMYVCVFVCGVCMCVCVIVCVCVFEFSWECRFRHAWSHNAMQQCWNVSVCLQGIFVKDSNTLAFYNFMSGATVQLQMKERGGRKKWPHLIPPVPAIVSSFWLYIDGQFCDFCSPLDWQSRSLSWAILCSKQVLLPTSHNWMKIDI